MESRMSLMVIVIMNRSSVDPGIVVISVFMMKMPRDKLKVPEIKSALTLPSSSSNPSSYTLL